MCKKGIIAGVVGAALLGGLFFGTDAGSYCKVAGGWVKDSFQNAVPIETEIELARQMVDELKPEIRKNMYLIAKEEVEIQRLDEQIAAYEQRSAKQRDELAQLSGAAATGKTSFQFASRTYSVEQVKKDMHSRLERCKRTDETLENLKGIRDSRQSTLEAARTKLDNMLAKRSELKSTIESLDARLRRIEAEQTASSYALDDSRLSDLKDKVSHIQTRLNAAEKMIDLEEQLNDGEIPVEDAETTPDDIVDQVTSYLNGDAEEQLAAAPVEADTQ